MIENPVGAALAYKQVVQDVMSILVGMKTERRGDRSNATSPHDPDSLGVIGTPWAFFGKTETTGSGSLHFHIVSWGGLSPDLLEAVVCTTIVQTAAASAAGTSCSCRVGITR